VKEEIRLDRVLRRGVDERLESRPHLVRCRSVHAGGRKRGRLTLDPEAEIDHVEDIMVGPDGRGFDGE
jgi:hypothetical protein